MATYVDMDDRLLQCVSADPRYVAQMVGLHTNAVVNRGTLPIRDTDFERVTPKVTLRDGRNS
jgi:hypothetical protein